VTIPMGDEGSVRGPSVQRGVVRRRGGTGARHFCEMHGIPGVPKSNQKQKSKGSLTRGYATLEAGACAVDCRTTSSGSMGISAGESFASSIRASKVRAASRPIQPGAVGRWSDWGRLECRSLNVVESITEISCGTRSPASWKAELPREQKYRYRQRAR